MRGIILRDSKGKPLQKQPQVWRNSYTKKSRELESNTDLLIIIRISICTNNLVGKCIVIYID